MLQYFPYHCLSSFHFYSKWINSETLMLFSCLLFTLLRFLGEEKSLCVEPGEVFVEFW